MPVKRFLSLILALIMLTGCSGTEPETADL